MNNSLISAARLRFIYGLTVLSNGNGSVFDLLTNSQNFHIFSSPYHLRLISILLTYRLIQRSVWSISIAHTPFRAIGAIIQNPGLKFCTLVTVIWMGIQSTNPLLYFSLYVCFYRRRWLSWFSIIIDFRKSFPNILLSGYQSVVSSLTSITWWLRWRNTKRPFE